MLNACQEKEFLTPEVGETSIVKNKTEDLAFPFANEEELNQFKGSSNVIYYEMARKTALLEAQLLGYVQRVNWNGYHLSEKPVVIYDFNSKPKFYDFIALDTENNPIGTIRVNATKNDNSSIKSIYTKTFNYNELLSKSAASKPSFFVDWKGAEYVGLKSKSGEAPTQIISNNGESISQSDVKEPTNDEIISSISEMLSKIGKDNQQEFDLSTVRDSMLVSLAENKAGAEAFWKSISEIENELMQSSDEEINDSHSKFFGRAWRWFSRNVLKTDETPYRIDKYHNERFNYRVGKGFWCGPWVCGYILWVNQRVDKYSSFEALASTFGEFGFGNLLLRAFGRPMTPAEMSWTMPLLSNGKIHINRTLNFRDATAYEHIKSMKPAILLCSSNGELHWTLGYGAKKNRSRDLA